MSRIDSKWFRDQKFRWSNDQDKARRERAAYDEYVMDIKTNSAEFRKSMEEMARAFSAFGRTMDPEPMPTVYGDDPFRGS